MAQDRTEALGQIVKDLRKAKGLNQDELGTRAGYGAGAGVALSRLETGQLKPGAQKLQAIAEVFGLTLEELEARASEQAGDNSNTTATAANRPRGAESPQARTRRIQLETEAREKCITNLSEKFVEAQDRARDEFFVRFVEIAERIEGAQKPDATRPQGDDAAGADADEVVARKLRDTSDGIAQLFAAGGVATNIAVSWLRGGVGAMGLAGVFAAPLVALATGGLVFMIKRNRKQQQELAAQLDAAEAELNADEQGFNALKNVLPRATEVLDYIAIHAGHALNRWDNQLGPGRVTWGQLGPEGQQRYNDFIAISAAHVTVSQIDVQSLLTTRDSDDLSRRVTDVDRELSVSRAAVEARV